MTAVVEETPEPVGHVVYRLVQELVINVLRHAQATAVTVTVARQDQGVRVEVRDGGRGAAPSRPGRPTVGAGG